MQLERLIIEAGDRTLAADFHPKLTVIGGLERAEREALAGEVLDSMAGARPGIHLELSMSDGRSLTVFRPANGKHRVVDTETPADVTAEFTATDGTIDLFAGLGIGRATARRLMRLQREDLQTRGKNDEYVARLAAVDQNALWAAAEDLLEADQTLSESSEHAGASVEDAALVDTVEERHAALVEATEQFDRLRLLALGIGDITAIVGLTLVLQSGFLGVPFLVVALGAAVAGFLGRRRVDAAKAAERDALHRAGANDYLAFHLERVNGLLADDDERRRFMKAVTMHRKALDAWRALAGEIPVAFAVEHEEQIRATARLQTGVGTLQFLSETAPVVSKDVTAELAQSLLARIDEVRALGPAGEVIPMIVDDPFENLESTMKPMLLEMLSAAAGSPQLILLTSDEDVTSWARLEAMTGDVAVIEPRIDVRPSIEV